MTVDTFLRICQEALLLIVLLSALPVLTSLAVGLVVSIFQASTQLQEQTLTIAPKIVAVFTVLGIAGFWMIEQTVKFGTLLLESIATVRG